LDAQSLDDLLQVASLVVQRATVVDPLGLDVTTTVVREAAMTPRKLCDLLIPILHAVDLAMDKNKVAPLTLLLIIEVAAIGTYDGHGIDRFFSAFDADHPRWSAVHALQIERKRNQSEFWRNAIEPGE